MRLKHQKGDHACGLQEVGDLFPQNWVCWDSSEPNVLLEECNYNEGQSSNIPHDARASILNTDGQLRDILSDMEPINTDDQVRNTLSDVEPIDIEYLLGNNQRVVNFLKTGKQEDKQRFVNLLHAKLDREWEARKAVSQARRTPRRTDIYAYVEDLGINSSLIHPHYELPIDMVASSRKKKVPPRYNNSQEQAVQEHC
jgi:hypothetical protein